MISLKSLEYKILSNDYNNKNILTIEQFSFFFIQILNLCKGFIFTFSDEKVNKNSWQKRDDCKHVESSISS